MIECIALIRGINVGRARRIAMSDLRELVEGLGPTGVRTLLNSGNVLFKTPRPSVGKLARSIETGISSRFGFSASVIVITAADLSAIIQENPLRAAAKNPAKHLVAFASNPAILARTKTLLMESLAPDALAFGEKAAYLWCENGVIESKLFQAFTRITGDAATIRNWATVLKLQAAMSPRQNAA